VPVTLVPGARGAFEVFVDGRRVFSKLEEHRFPEEDEVIEDIPSA
jgi:selT/selW/selH-like putative selenoprotein